MDEGDIKEFLMRTDEEFRKLVRQHQEYESQLRTFLQKSYLSEQEQLDETTIKKKKLAVKDQMQVKIYRYQAQAMH